MNQSSAVTLTPVPASSSSSECEILSKAALRLRMIVRRAVSSARRILLVILTRAVSVLCFGPKPDWSGSKRL